MFMDSVQTPIVCFVESVGDSRFEVYVTLSIESVKTTGLLSHGPLWMEMLPDGLAAPMGTIFSRVKTRQLLN